MLMRFFRRVEELDGTLLYFDVFWGSPVSVPEPGCPDEIVHNEDISAHAGEEFCLDCIPKMDTQRQGKMIIKSKSKSSKFRTRPFAVDVFDEPGCCVRTEDNLDQREQHGTQPPE